MNWLYLILAMAALMLLTAAVVVLGIIAAAIPRGAYKVAFQRLITRWPFWLAGLIIIIVGVLIAFPEGVVDYVELLETNYSLQADEGLILLDTPQVFTRRRLVNDRSIETAWLTERLDQTNKLLDQERFAKPQLVELAQRRLTAALNHDTSVPTSAQTDELMKRLTDLALKSSPLDQFEDAVLYREAIRNSILSTALDDRHDLEGNALYRLNFNAAVLPPKASKRVAAVVIKMSEFGPDQAPADIDAKYTELLWEWADKLTRQLEQTIDDRYKSIAQDVGFNAAEDRQFGEWALSEIEKFLPRPIDSRLLTEWFATQYRQAETFDYVNPLIGTFFDQPKTATIADAIKQCEVTGRLDVRSLSRVQGEKPTSSPPSEGQDRICSPTHASNTKVLLYLLENLRFIKDRASVDKEIDRCAADPLAFRDLLRATAVPSYDEEGDRTSDRCLKNGTAIFFERQRQDLGTRRLRIVAEFVVDDWSNHKISKLPLPALGEPGGKNALGAIFDFQLPRICNRDRCAPVVSLNPELLKRTGKLQWVQRALTAQTNAFTYSVVPNKMFDRAESAQGADSDLSASAKVGSASPLLTSSSSVSNMAVEKSAALIGFGDWGNFDKSHPSTETRFGWVMFPRHSAAWSLSKHQLPEEFSASALISVPGWWKTAHLEVMTCWISETDLRHTSDLNNVCKKDTARPRYHLDLRLPAEAESISQALRFDVISFPYLFSRQPPIFVEIGRPAKIVLLGGRLWRSPIVRLGSQPATSVEVLPDMQGITAYFSCVLPPPGAAGDEKPVTEPISVPVSVFTTEGSTPTFAQLLPFSVRAGEEAKAGPCWPKRQATVEFSAPVGTPHGNQTAQ